MAACEEDLNHTTADRSDETCAPRDSKVAEVHYNHRRWSMVVIPEWAEHDE